MFSTGKRKKWESFLPERMQDKARHTYAYYAYAYIHVLPSRDITPFMVPLKNLGLEKQVTYRSQRTPV